ncbi:MAG: aminotransferase class I/II-fold pyridoxal phosphate-dependent enzyme [Pseudomonadota bacterium]
MRFSPLVERLSAGAAAEGVGAWAIHARALAAKARGEDVLILSVGDPDLDTPAPIRAAAKAALDAGDTHYTGILGRPELRARVAAWFAERARVAVGPENVMITAGAQNALYFAARCVLGAGDEALSPEPTYVSYAPTVTAAGATLIRTPSPAETGFRPDLDALEAAVTPRARALMIGDPNNPTGVVLSPKERARIAEIARAHDLWVIADTVYAALAFERAHGWIASEPGMAERTVTVGGVSKSHAMTGWRVGWAIGPAPLIEAFDALGHCALYGLPGFAQAGALAALDDPTSPEEMRAVYRRRRDALMAGLAQISGLRVELPEAGMFALVDIRPLIREIGLSTAAFAERLFQAEGVSVLDGAAFGPSAAGHLRLSMAAPEPEIEAACRRLARFVGGLGRSG